MRWNKQLSEAFDVSRAETEPSRLEYDWSSKFLGCQVRDVAVEGIMVPSARMGSVLTALDQCIGAWKVIDTRNLTHQGKESPPAYETIKLSSTKTATFLIEGTRFLERDGGKQRLAVKIEPGWGGVSLSVYAHRAATGDASADGFLASLTQRAAGINFLKGEAFSLSGEFLTKTGEMFGDVFLEVKNHVALKRASELIQTKGLGFDSRGMIFMGPPGTGKTLGGRVLMNEAPATFIWMAAKDFWMAGAMGGLTYAFELAKECAPTILFLEDVDNWLDGHSVDLLKSEMDGVARSKGVMTVLTTNFPELLPDALIDRPGRFHDVLLFELPTKTVRGRMLAKWLPGLKAETTQHIVDGTEGMSGAHMKELANFATILMEQDSIPLDNAATAALAKVKEQRELITEAQRGRSSYRRTAGEAQLLAKAKGSWLTPLTRLRRKDEQPAEQPAEESDEPILIEGPEMTDWLHGQKDQEKGLRRSRGHRKDTIENRDPGTGQFTETADKPTGGGGSGSGGGEGGGGASRPPVAVGFNDAGGESGLSMQEAETRHQQNIKDADEISKWREEIAKTEPEAALAMQSAADGWTKSSFSPEGMVMQRSVSEKTRSPFVYYKGGSGSGSDSDAEMYETQLKERGIDVRAATELMYDVTQQTLTNAKVSELKVYRGVSFDAGKVVAGEHAVSANPLSSWTTDKAVAVDFAKRDVIRDGFVMTMTVPAKHVFATAPVLAGLAKGASSMAEHEVVVMAHSGMQASFQMTRRAEKAATGARTFDGFGGKVDLTQNGVKVVGAPEPGDMAAINRLAIKELTPEEVCVFEFKVCSDQIDRDGEKFSIDVLEDFAESLPGKSLIEAHVWGPVGIGRFFGARLEQDATGETWLMARAYMLRADADASNMITKIEGGVAWAVSIGFFAPERTPVEANVTGQRAYQEYRRGPNGEKGEAIEVSLVFLGAQYDASVAKTIGGFAAIAAKSAAVMSRMSSAIEAAAKKVVDEQVRLITTQLERAALRGKGGTMKATKSMVLFSKEDGVCRDQDTGEVIECPEEMKKMNEEQIKAVLTKALGVALEPITKAHADVLGALAEMKAAQTQFGEKLLALESKVGPAVEEVKELTEFGSKLMDRVEEMELELGGSRALVGDPDGDEQPNPADKNDRRLFDEKGRKRADAVYGDSIIPRDYRGGRRPR